MEVIGIIAEFNPFHNGHLYFINKIKEMYPESIIILVLNGYFLERGITSLESKEVKTKLALEYGIDLVIELPFVFGSNSSDIFAESALELLNQFKINKLIFGSECNDIKYLTKICNYQLSSEFDENIKKYMSEGINYPTALNKANPYKVNTPNDILAVSYIKAILKNNYPIEPISIKRTNDYHDLKSTDKIVSASNIREKIKNNISINDYIPSGKVNNINEDLLFTMLKYKIITEDNLEKYLTVDEGIENRLKKVINEAHNIDELILKVKTKRYTYNRIMRMFIHILIGLTKEDKEKLINNEYIRILGLNKTGQTYLNKIKKEFTIPLVSSFTNLSSKIKDYELKAANIYYLLTNDEDVLKFEHNNKPIKLD